MAQSRHIQPPSINTQVSYIPKRISHLGKAEIARLLNPASSSDWRMLASHLNFTDTDIQNYEARNGTVIHYNVTVEVLRKWEQRFSGDVDLKELQDALLKFGRQDVLGIIRDLINDDKFFDCRVPPSPSSSSSSNGSPRSNSRQSPFPSAPLIHGFQHTANEDEIFKSDLQGGMGREPTEDSYSSLNSIDLPPDTTENKHLTTDAYARTQFKTSNGASFNNSGPSANGGPPPLPENFTQNLRNQRKSPKPSGSQMTNRGLAMEQLPTSQLPPGAIPKTSHYTSQKGSQVDSVNGPSNMKRSTSCENTSSSSSESSMNSYDCSTWPNKENPLKSDPHFMNKKHNPHKLKEEELRAPGDYRSPGEKMFHSLPEGRYDFRTDSNWAERNHEPHSHRQVDRNRENSLISQVSYGISSAPHQCPSGIAYGITFSWKDWKCGMDLARKLKIQGHHVELDRKTSWYRDEAERDRKLPKVFGSCKFIIVIITANYMKEILGKAETEINAKFIFNYMKTEYTRNKNKNTRFIPIVDTRNVRRTDSMFEKYPMKEHNYIIRLIRQQGVIVERQYSMPASSK